MLMDQDEKNELEYDDFVNAIEKVIDTEEESKTTQLTR